MTTAFRGSGVASRSPSLGLVLPTLPQSGDHEGGLWAGLATCARDAEAGGAQALWACDHLFWHRPTLECFVALTVAAGVTSRCLLGTAVLQLPLRRPAVVAKQAGSLHQVCGGRLVLGVGVGEHPGEYEVAGAEYSRRGRALDEGIRELRTHWSCGSGPYPMLPLADGIPVWIGGSSPAARSRAARLGDGWIPVFLSPDRVKEELGLLAKEAETVGRDPSEVTPAVVVFVSVGPRHDAHSRGTGWLSSLYGLPARKFDRHVVSGDAGECAESLWRYIDAGVEHVAVFIAADEPLGAFLAVAEELALSSR